MKQQIKAKTGDEVTDAEPADEFMARCRLQAKKCKFHDDKEKRGRLGEQLIAATPYSDIQKDLLAKDDKLALEEAIQVARNHEASLSHMK